MDFVCNDPLAMVRGANVRATLEAFALVPSVGQRIVTRHHLDLHDMTPDKFIPVQRWLDALREIQESVGVEVVRRVGSGIFRNAHFPATFGTVESVLEKLDDIYHLNHRGDVGHYRCKKGDAGLSVRCETPYPRHFEWGLIEGICESHLAKEGRFFVSYEPGRRSDPWTCTVTVRAHKDI